MKDGKRNGRGIYTYPNGNYYDGRWKDDKRNGRGRERIKNGDVYDEYCG